MSRHYLTPESPQVSILLIQDQASPSAKVLIDSIYRNSYQNFEVIVVNLGNKEKEITSLYIYFPTIIQINLKRGTEMELAFSEGLKVAKGDYLLFLHSVGEVNDVFLENLVQATKKNSRVGIVSPQVRHFTRRELCLFSGLDKPYKARGLLNFSLYQNLCLHLADYAANARIACNDAFLVSMDLIKKMEEKRSRYFFLDELDMAETVHKNKYKIFYEPSAIAYLHPKMGNEMSAENVYVRTRNRLASIRKHRGDWMLVGILFLLFLSYLPKHTFQRLLDFRPDHILAIYRGIFWNIIHSNKVGDLIANLKWKS